MKHAYLLAAMAIMIFLSGCLTNNVQLGCCIQANATDPTHPGCLLYNTSDYTNTSYMSSTHWCNTTTLNCNVTIGTVDYIIPICSGGELVSCVSPACTAMVCGDFAFRPTAPPGYNDVNSSQGDTPVSGQSSTLQFYKAQCRFLPMDAKLKNIMASSKSQINVFRIGVGGSFDEFDQYRYFFPISDQYCNINPPTSPGDTRVDRYMNYLAPSGSEVDGEPTAVAYSGGISSDCLNDTNAPPPFGFGEPLVSKTSALPDGKTTLSYNTELPDKSEYKNTYEYRVDYSAVWQTGNGGFYSYNGNNLSTNVSDRIMKEIDDSFYKEALTIAYADYIYGNVKSPSGQQITRAPFECDSEGNDCYSGSCDTSTYNRGLLQNYDGSTGVTQDVVADCDEVTDNIGLTKVVCGATKSITTNGASAPTITPVYVDILPLLLEDQRGVNQESGGENPNPNYNSYQSQSSNTYAAYWGNFSNSEIVNESFIGYGTATQYSIIDVDFYLAKKKNCTSLYGPHAGLPDENETVNCSALLKPQEPPPGAPVPTSLGQLGWTQYNDMTNVGPSLGGAVFFGKTGDDPSQQVNYDGSDIIGYAVVSPDDFDDLAVVKDCGLDTTFTTPPFPTATDTTDDAKSQCITQCTNLCGPAPAYGNCTDWCSTTTPDPSTQPCVMPQESKDVIGVSTYDPTKWGPLMNAFEPYYMQRMKSLLSTGFSDGCGGSLNVLDGVISSMPWVLEYKKGVRLPDWILGNDSDPIGSGPPDLWYPEGKETSELFLSSVPALIQRQRNTFDDIMLGVAGTSSCEMRRDTFGYWNSQGLQYYSFSNNQEVDYVPYYSLVYSQNIFLFKYNSTTKKLGKCDVDPDSLLPVVKTLGWCKPCTTSTLAYQKITTWPHVYLPNYTVNVDQSTAKNEQGICAVTYDTSWELFNPLTADNVSCFNPQISDIQDYQGEIGIQGSPRTVPDASIIKEKIGNYMKSGVLPVFDMSDPSNWIKSNPDCDWDASKNKCTKNFNFNWWQTALYGPKSDYLDYDFQNLFANMGAAVVIVEHVTSLNDLNQPTTFHFWDFNIALPSKIQTIKDHAQIIRDYCRDCLVAFEVDSPNDSETFGDIVASAMSDPTAKADIDLITFNYSVTDHDDRTLGNATAVADDLASYGFASMNRTGKPTMVVGFSVDDNDPYWKNDYVDLFDTMVGDEGTLLKGGIIGIIYTPARQAEPSGNIYGGSGIGGAIGQGVQQETGGIIGAIHNIGSSDNSLVSVDSNGQGVKGAKFCAFQDAMHEMSTVPPIAMITKTGVADSVNCTACTSVDINDGSCGPPTGSAPGSLPLCDDGAPCTLPPGLDASDAKCPANTIVAQCMPCSSMTTTTFNCTETYSNWTKENIDGPVSELTDSYSDVLAGLPAPYKCCINDSSGNNYTYTEQEYSGSEDTPVVFSGSGDPNVDCGFGTTTDEVNTVSSFCGVQAPPLKDFDIKCCLNCTKAP